jgi:hypothetical protein
MPPFPPFRTLRPSSTSISRWFRRFLGACKRASGLRRLELLACLQVPRSLEVILLKIRGSVLSATTATTCSAVHQRQVNISIFYTYAHAHIHTHMHTCKTTYIHPYKHARATWRTHLWQWQS